METVLKLGRKDNNDFSGHCTRRNLMVTIANHLISTESVSGLPFSALVSFLLIRNIMKNSQGSLGNLFSESHVDKDEVT